MPWTFNGFVVDPQGYRLLRGEHEIALERRAFDLLCYLLTHRDRVVTKDELLEQVWQAKSLSDGVLSNTVAKLRRALDQKPSERTPIETTHGRGYRFCAETTLLGAAPPVSVQPRLESEVARRDPFVGRESLLRALSQRLTRIGGSENIAVLAGEAGIGKTRTARELAQQAREENLSVWFGSAYEGVVDASLLALDSDSASRRRNSPKRLGGSSCHPGRVIASSCPSSSAPTVPAPRMEPQVARFRVFEEISRFLRRASERKPLLLIIDDLQCADLASLELLRFAARALQDLPVMFLVTLRKAGPSRPSSSSPWISSRAPRRCSR